VLEEERETLPRKFRQQLFFSRVSIQAEPLPRRVVHAGDVDQARCRQGLAPQHPESRASVKGHGLFDARVELVVSRHGVLSVFRLNVFEKPGGRHQVVNLPVHEIARRDQDVRSGLPDLLDDFFQAAFPDNHADVDVRDLHDPDSAGLRGYPGCSEGHLFRPDVFCLMVSVCVEGEGQEHRYEENLEGRGRQKRQVAVRKPAGQIDEQTVCVDQDGHGEKKKEYAHPDIADVREGAGGGLVTEALRNPDQYRSQDQEGHQEDQDGLCGGCRVKSPFDFEEDVPVKASVEDEESDQEKGQGRFDSHFSVTAIPGETPDHASRTVLAKNPVRLRRSPRSCRDHASVVYAPHTLRANCG